MPNVCLAAGLRLTVVISLFFIGKVPARGQGFSGASFQAVKNRTASYSPWGTFGLEENPAPSVPESQLPQEVVAGGAVTVSSDILRHPLTWKARRLLLKAMHHADAGNHPAAIQGLHEALAKDPSSAPYVDNLLGMEYMQTNQFTEAKSSFEEAVRLMPHESINHSNLGLSMAYVGEWDSAEQEVRQALQLDRGNAKAKSILETLLLRKRTKTTVPHP
jgi:Flp pilus assembly protein TadD